MEIRLIRELEGYYHFRVKEAYDVFLLDGIFLCMCSIKYKRKINTYCKHIHHTKKYLKENGKKLY